MASINGGKPPDDQQALTTPSDRRPAPRDPETTALEAKAKMRELVYRAEQAREKVRSIASLDHHADRRPWVVVGVGLGLGLLAGARQGRRAHIRHSQGQPTWWQEHLVACQEDIMREQRRLAQGQKELMNGQHILQESLLTRERAIVDAVDRHQRALIGALEEVAQEQRREIAELASPADDRRQRRRGVARVFRASDPDEDGGEFEGRDIEDEMYASASADHRTGFEALHQDEPFEMHGNRRPPPLERQAHERPPQWRESLAAVAQSALHGVVRALAARAIEEIASRGRDHEGGQVRSADQPTSAKPASAHSIEATEGRAPSH